VHVTAKRKRYHDAMTVLDLQAELPPAPGADTFLSLDFADSAASLPGGQSYDLLGTPEAAMRWLRSHELSAPEVQLYEVCADRMRTLRDHVRVLLGAHVDGAVPPEAAVTALNDALTRVPTAALLVWDTTSGPCRVQAHPTDQAVNHALATLAADTAQLLTGRDSSRLARCEAQPCDRFLVRTHGRRQWCSTRCGDRVRAARARRRNAVVIT
jgi:predicted RNA-binding Zn ribbon-like protein